MMGVKINVQYDDYENIIFKVTKLTQNKLINIINLFCM